MALKQAEDTSEKMVVNLDKQSSVTSGKIDQYKVVLQKKVDIIKQREDMQKRISMMEEMEKGIDSELDQFK